MKVLLSLLLMFSCITLTVASNAGSSVDVEGDKSAVADTEKAFAVMAAKEGLKKAFLFYADDNAVLNRGNKIIKGKSAIAEYFDQNPTVFEKFVWSPDFVEVSGDLAYTYGPYEYALLDKEGKLKTGAGVFHTVWKRQANGNWRYVWD